MERSHKCKFKEHIVLEATRKENLRLVREQRYRNVSKMGEVTFSLLQRILFIITTLYLYTKSYHFTWSS